MKKSRISFSLKRVSGKFVYHVILVLLYCVGCSNVNSYLKTRQTDHSSSTPIMPNESVAIVFDRSLNLTPAYKKQIEKKANQCISKSLSQFNPPIRTIPPEQFRQTVFPDMESSIIPVSPRSLSTLVKSAEFRRRTDLLNLRYLIIFTGTDASSIAYTKGLAIPIMLSPYGLIYFGNVTETTVKTISTTVEIFDVKHLKNKYSIDLTLEGSSIEGLIGIIPYYIPEFTESYVCDELGKSVSQLIKGHLDSNNSP